MNLNGHGEKAYHDGSLAEPGFPMGIGSEKVRVDSSPNTNGSPHPGLKKERRRDGGADPGGRICDVLPHLRAYDFGDSDGSSDILGKQIELESGNALQYRTCSWQKVRTSFA